MSRAKITSAALLLAAGCVAQTDDGGPWEPAGSAAGQLAPELGPAPLPLSDDTRCTVRIASWNVHYGEDAAGLAVALAASPTLARADVLLVQEIEAYPTEAASRTARLAAALGMTWVYVPARPEGGGTHGIGVLGRLPLEEVHVRQLPYFEQPLRPRQRVASRVEVAIGAHRLAIVNVHLDVRLGAVDRIRQLHPAVNDIPERVVVGGDFNTNPWAWFDGLIPLAGTEAVVGQEQGAVVDDYLAGKGLTSAIPIDAATMRVPGVDVRVDNLYARGVPIVAAGVEHVDGSDHWPVWVDVDVCE